MLGNQVAPVQHLAEVKAIPTYCTNQVTAWLRGTTVPDDRGAGLPFTNAHVISLPDDTQKSKEMLHISLWKYQ